MKQALDKMSFISDSCVKEFITWMLKKLDSDFEHRYKNLKTKEYWECSSIYNAYERYAWPFSVDGKKGCSFEDSVQVLGKLSCDLKEAIDKENNELCKDACLKILKWGGVLHGNKEKIEKQENLVQYLKEAKRKLITGKIENPDVYKEVYMNSGFTKIYSLYIDDFIIYDSRVGVALAFLVRRHCEENGLPNVPDLLRFAYGNSKGKANRNPNLGDYKFPLLRNAGYYDNHIENNLKANWLLKEVLSHPSKFTSLPADRQLRSLEAALFMIGYCIPPCDEKSE